MSTDDEQPGPSPDSGRSDSPQPDRPEEPEHDDAGLGLARDVSRATAAATGAIPKRRKARRTGPANLRTVRGQVSGAHPDERDPQLLETTMERLVSAHGWELDLRVHAVFGRWAELVGEQVAAHSTPESFEGGRLVVRTDSTAWATQLKLLAANVVRTLNEELGHGTVVHIEVLGPHGPSWKKGRLSVRGRGPRDTYG